jgi:hypothetical protein
VSSHTYSTELSPDPFLRRVVILFGIAAAVVGLATILALSMPPVWRAFAALLWLIMNGRELVLIAKGYKQCRRIRIGHDGDVELLGRDGSWMPATLVSGSVVLRQYAWLRFETREGLRFAEPVRAKNAQSEGWRRLQVIWRHLGAGG